MSALCPNTANAIKRIPPPVVSIPPGMEIWHESNIAARLKTDEDRFQYHHMEQIAEEIMYSGASYEMATEFYKANSPGLKAALNEGKSFRVIPPTPKVLVSIAMKQNIRASCPPPICERRRTTIIWDKNCPEEIENAKQMFDGLQREGLRPSSPFDVQEESATLKGYTVKREEIHFFSIKGAYEDAKRLRRFLEMTPKERERYFDELRPG